MIYLITNRILAVNKEFYEIIEESISAGISAIIIREKDLSYYKLLKMAKKIKGIIGKRNVKLIINSDLKVAEEIEAYGFHSSYKNFIERRLQLEFNGVIGVSVHSLEEAIEAERQSADYLLVGHIFETKCKKKLEPKGLEILKLIKRKVSIPIIALGGIKPENIMSVMSVIKYPIDDVAVMSTIMESKNPFLEIKNYIEKVNKA
ncbi:MAG: thiamine phosphate synthase [Clostridium sp.]